MNRLVSLIAGSSLALFLSDFGVAKELLTRQPTEDVNSPAVRNRQSLGPNTNLLFNGCPISHVKEILGHDRLETTCRYYLGLDKSKAKEAHGKFLNY